MYSQIVALVVSVLSWRRWLLEACLTIISSRSVMHGIQPIKADTRPRRAVAHRKHFMLNINSTHATVPSISLFSPVDKLNWSNTQYSTLACPPTTGNTLWFTRAHSLWLDNSKSSIMIWKTRVQCSDRTELLVGAIPVCPSCLNAFCCPEVHLYCQLEAHY